MNPAEELDPTPKDPTPKESTEKTSDAARRKKALYIIESAFKRIREQRQTTWDPPSGPGPKQLTTDIRDVIYLYGIANGWW